MRAVLFLACLTNSARADEGHHHHHQHGTDTPNAAVLAEHRHGVGASLGLVLADYDSTLFRGEYQGTAVGGWWMRGRFGVAASVPAYRLTKNGLAVSGLGDVMFHGHAMLFSRNGLSVDVMAMVSAPTGDDHHGLGMGHVMAMPELGARWARSRIAVSARIGYGHMVGGVLEHAQHGQKMWPLVDPMNAKEMTADARTMVALAPMLAIGVHGQAAAPIGDGETRVIGGGRVVWVVGRVQTSFQLDHGFVGDPFGLRGLLETAVAFN